METKEKGTPAMQPIATSERIVRNVHTDEFVPFVWEGGVERGVGVLQCDDNRRPGYGFHIFKMEPGAVTTFHEHTAAEHFYVVEGDATDHDGYQYKPGDIVLLKKGTHHHTSTKNGCTLVVVFETEESLREQMP